MNVNAIDRWHYNLTHSKSKGKATEAVTFGLQTTTTKKSLDIIISNKRPHRQTKKTAYIKTCFRPQTLLKIIGPTLIFRLYIRNEYMF
jgi:hypothetical protein